MAESGTQGRQEPAADKPKAPLADRIDQFRKAHPEIHITAPYRPYGQWEVSEPGRAAAAYDVGAKMMDELEKRYPG